MVGARDEPSPCSPASSPVGAKLGVLLSLPSTDCETEGELLGAPRTKAGGEEGDSPSVVSSPGALDVMGDKLGEELATDSSTSDPSESDSLGAADSKSDAVGIALLVPSSMPDAGDKEGETVESSPFPSVKPGLPDGIADGKKSFKSS